MAIAGIVYEYEQGYEELLKDIVGMVGRLLKKIENFPYSQKKNLGDQLSRSLVSIPSNLEEGRGRAYRGAVKVERQFLSYALGSAREAVVQLKVASTCGLIKIDQRRKSVELLGDVILFIEGRIDSIVVDGYRESNGNSRNAEHDKLSKRFN